MNESIEYQTLKAEELVSKCKNEPYLLAGDSDDIEYLEIVKKYPTLFIADHNAIFYYKFIKDFWLKEIETFFFFSSKEEVRLLDIVTPGLKSFSNAFKFEHPKLSIDFANAALTENYDEYHYIREQIEYGQLTPADMIVEFITKNVFRGKNVYKFRNEQGVIIQRMNNSHISILSEIKKLLRVVPDNRIPLNVLCHKLNSSDGEFDIKKPIDQSKLRKAILNEKNGRLEIDSADNVNLVSEIEFLPKYFFENRELLANFNFNKSTSGILAFSYLGNKFPLNEAEEYVNVRPVIHLALVKNLKEEFPKLISDLTENEQFTPEREFMFFLKAVLPEDASAVEWLNENIAVSFYEEDAQDLKLVMPKIIGHLSPVFNLAQNPGHLFPYTLKEKLENFTKKKIGEIDDGK
ncbi:MAG: hypothetical protein GW805_12710 [Ignavibacteria bacterium]|nr:hypothetical protein [Ignavibacteria bacterium]NCS80429.1 hypothetical protein [Ignavibacteria bacterium]